MMLTARRCSRLSVTTLPEIDVVQANYLVSPEVYIAVYGKENAISKTIA